MCIIVKHVYLLRGVCLFVCLLRPASIKEIFIINPLSGRWDEMVLFNTFENISAFSKIKSINALGKNSPVRASMKYEGLGTNLITTISHKLAE